jgi:CheY-like chemotaxis protein
MDVNLPVMDGLTAVRAIRGSPGPNRGTPIIMLSASVRAQDYDAGAAAGADAYLAKPIDFVSLRGVLADTVREAESPTRDEASAAA